MRLHRDLGHLGKIGYAGLSFKWLLLLVVLFAALPVTQAMAADLSSGQAERDVYEALQAGGRLPVERGYEIPSKPTVFLTFDDGPSTHTADVLNILQSEQVAATFFVLGEHVDKYPETVKRIVREGHAVGNHTYNHVYNKLYGSFDEFWKQIMRTEATLEEKAGVRTRLIRAPGGTYTNFDASYFYYLEQAGYVINDWNVDSGDSRRQGVPAAEIRRDATNLTTAKKAPNQVVVLMHDSSGHGETVKALPDIIRFYKDNGYEFAPLTLDIQPIQSQLGKLKWSRSSDFSDFTRRLAQAREHAARWEADTAREADGMSETQSGASELPVSTAAVPTPQPALLPLGLHFDDSALTLEPSEYSFRDGKFYVPLRTLVETMGGRVEWRENSRQAIASYGLHQVAYDLPNRSIAASFPSKPDERLALADISLIDNKLMVPLRLAVELLGGEIADYTIDADRREVRIAEGDGYGAIISPRVQDLL
ncbi:polysaccharide deacetylase [Paenibacillus mesophilus]|uniref:polysaccharide deacetylase n=1 Tax=Paenibacillus mesophilus TaxID=2582849 RepID=UPI00110EACA2|nr:polysaccharide deacetylase [Paenibacillus mesophilus]TMV44447.1 polysaccharide deacetylase [Paenibacillus mesophilus]